MRGAHYPVQGGAERSLHAADEVLDLTGLIENATNRDHFLEGRVVPVEHAVLRPDAGDVAGETDTGVERPHFFSFKNGRFNSSPMSAAVSYTHLRAHETRHDLV